jgi:uncharacterized protein
MMGPRLLALVALLALAAGAASAEVAVPALKARVTDLTGTLTAQQTQDLDRVLAALEGEKGSQVAVLIVPTTRPETIEQYGIRVADAWKLGRKGVDDGAILLVAKDDRSLRIEVGYGLEGVLPDAIAERIISETIVPRFKAGNFYDGILAGVQRIIGVIHGEPLPPPSHRVEARGRGSIDTLFAIVFAAAVVGSFLSLVFGRLTAGIVTGGVTGLLAWLLLSSVVMALLAGAAAFVLSVGEVFRQGYRSGGWPGGPWSGGGWSAGGGSSGGTWGGGGGGFGGGGASGRW